MNRKSFDEAITAMAIQSSSFAKDYIFYLYMVSKCNIVFKNDLKSVAAVNFKNNHYNLFINLSDYVVNSERPNELILGFGKLPLEHRIGIIKHEMLHIINSFVLRRNLLKKQYNEKFFTDLANIAEDCALNQQINRLHLPSYAIYPDMLEKHIGIPVLKNESTEYYYKILIENKEKYNLDFTEFNTVDSHDICNIGDEEIQKLITKNMIESSADSTLKAKGTLPSNYAEWINLLSTKAQLDWKKLLYKITGNKRINKHLTIRKPSRRNPDAMYIKGNIKDRVFNLLVIADVSGSVSDKELQYGLNEIQSICKKTSTAVNLIQVDTVAKDPEKITQSIKTFSRKANGGTLLHSALYKAKEHNIEYDAIIIITDGYISSIDFDIFKNTNKKIIWVLTSSIDLTSFNTNKMVGCLLHTNRG